MEKEKNLRATIVAQEQQIHQLQNEKKILQQESSEKISKLEQENAELRAKIQQLLHERYGKKSEKLPEEELPVIDEANVTPEEAATIQEAEQEISVASYTRGKRKPIPKEFVRETIIYPTLIS